MRQKTYNTISRNARRGDQFFAKLCVDRVGIKRTFHYIPFFTNGTDECVCCTYKYCAFSLIRFAAASLPTSRYQWYKNSTCLQVNGRIFLEYTTLQAVMYTSAAFFTPQEFMKEKRGKVFCKFFML